MFCCIDAGLKTRPKRDPSHRGHAVFSVMELFHLLVRQSVPKGRTVLDDFMCCHTETEVADQTSSSSFSSSSSGGNSCLRHEGGSALQLL